MMQQLLQAVRCCSSLLQVAVLVVLCVRIRHLLVCSLLNGSNMLLLLLLQVAFDLIEDMRAMCCASG
jgi:hypothetical protein